MTWSIGDHGFEMRGEEGAEHHPRHLRPWLEGGWAGTGWAWRTWPLGIHPGGPKILDAVEESLALPAR